MQEVKRFIRGQATRKAPLPPLSALARLDQLKKGWDAAVVKVKRLWGGEPGSPEDPYSYVGAPKKPLLPHFRAAAAVKPEP